MTVNRGNTTSERQTLAWERDLRPLPPPCSALIVRRTLQLLEDPADRSAEIADLVLADAGLALRLLSDANRAVVATGTAVGSVPVALQILGHDHLRAALMDLLAGTVIDDDPAHLELFRHSLVTSLVAGSLARVLETVDVAVARTAGLLHDVAAWDPAVGQDPAGRHAAVGARYLRREGLPDEIVRAVSQHHGVVPDARSDPAGALGSVLVMADCLAASLCGHSGYAANLSRQDELASGRIETLAEIALERAAREVADGLLVLGILLGMPGLSVETLSDSFAGRRERPVDAALPPAGLSPAIRRALRAIRHAPSEPESVRCLVRAVRETPAVGSALLILDDPGEAMLEGYAAQMPFFLRLRDVSASLPGFTELWQRVQTTGRSMLLEPTEADSPVFSRFKTTRLLAVPLRVARKAVGLVLAPDPEARLDAGAADALHLVATAFGEVLEALQLAHRSYLLSERIATDGLTGLLNREHFFERLAAEVRAANRYRRGIALVMIDVDTFKEWNDTYGHQVGDRMLRDVSKVIRDCARQGDLIGRYGGDEFIVALPGCNAEQALAFAERVRAQVEALGTIMRDSCYEFSLSVSVGVAAATSHPCEVDALVFRADHALYCAKEKGRNRVHADHH